MPPEKKSRQQSLKKSKLPPAITPEEREDRIIDMAVSLAEQQILDGTVSSQVLTHFLKLGTAKEKLELEKLKKENELLRAKADAIQSSQEARDTYAKVLAVFQSYRYDDNLTGAEEYEDY